MPAVSRLRCCFSARVSSVTNIGTDIIRLMDAGLLIRQARVAAGLTQAQLARAAGTSQPTLASYESGARSPSVRTLDKVVRAAGATIVASLEQSPPADGRLMQELRRHQQQIRELAQLRLIHNVRVFGSTARGEETEDSDVDLLVDYDAASRGVLALAAFASDVEALIGCPVDVSTPDLLRDEIRDEVLAEAVPL